MDREREEIYALLTKIHTPNIRQGDHSPAENVHNTMSGILRQWIEREKKYMPF